MKEYIKTTGFIIGNSAVKENSAVITVLTPDMGVINLIKHGYNSKKNIFKPLLQPINHLELYMELEKEQYKIIDCSAINLFSEIKKNYNKTVSVLSVFKTLVNSEIYDQKDYNLIFTLIKKFLSAVNDKNPCLLTSEIYFYFQLAWCLGISFSFKDDEKMDFCFLDIENGMFFQNKKNIEENNLYPVSRNLYDNLKKFMNIRFADIDKLNYISINEHNEFRKMYKRFTEYHFNKPVIIQPSATQEL